MRFPGTRWAQEVHHFAAFDEIQLREGQNPIAIEGGLETEVETLERFEGGEPRGQERHLDASTLAQAPLLLEQRLDEFERCNLTLLEATHEIIQAFQRRRHFQGDEMTADPIDGGDGRL